MPIHKLETVDAFVLTDFADVPASGYVRRARKILQASTWDMARSATYCFASFDIQRGGASAGINATDDVATDAVSAFRSELASTPPSSNLHLLAGKGVDDDGPTQIGSLLSASVLAATQWALGAALDGRTVAIEESAATPMPNPLRLALKQQGATIIEVEGSDEKPWMIWGAEADVLMLGSKPGVMKHEGAEMVNASVVVPWGPIPITTKALAVLAKRGVTYVPDFISAAGPLLETADAGSDAVDPTSVAERVVNALSDSTRGSEGSQQPLFLAAAKRAEAFMETWQPNVPFGRPLSG